ncbi:MAG: UrcA family protein [Caulobacterales bacterium]
MTRSIIFAALMATSLLGGTAARATDDIMVVRLGDLNISSDQGAKVAFKRITTAAKRFCDVGDYRALGRSAQQSACEARMVAKAVSSLDAPIVTALYAPQKTVLLASRNTH